MRLLLRIPYALAGAVAQGLTYIVPEGESKLQRGLAARRGILRRYRRWSDTHRNTSRPLAWFHAPSVGEGLQALPVIQLLRARSPEVQIAYTHYSPSAESFARATGADFTDYLPFDTFGAAHAAISSLRPTALIFSKLDVWPALTETAAARGTNIGIISATLPESSGRRSILARHALTDAYRAIHRVGAISDEDAARLREQGVASERITVTGDTRYDQVWSRANARTPDRLRSLRSSAPTLVAGSTWPADESLLLPAWIELRKASPQARLIIAPHEVTEDHLRSISTWAATNGLVLSRSSSPEREKSDILLVDQYGLLGDLYGLADVAYVGGGFHSAGLHSVLEPAAFGAPVIFGPNHKKSRDAAGLLECGGGHVATSRGDLTRALMKLFTSRAERYASAAAAKAMVERGLGAAERSFQLVRELLGP